MTRKWRNSLPLTFEQPTRNVQEWAAARGIYEPSNARAQLLKAFSEMGELADAEIKGDGPAAADAVGDVLVCLVNFCAMRGLNIPDCLAAAWDEIKDRKGRMIPGGAFVKDES